MWMIFCDLQGNILEHETERAPFDYINALVGIDLENVISFIQYEHPQTIALICMHLTTETLQKVFKHLHNDLVTEVVMRMMNIISVPKETIRIVDDILFEKMKAFDNLAQFDKDKSTDRIQKALTILDDKSVKYVLNIINQVDEEKFNALASELSKNNPEKLI